MLSHRPRPFLLAAAGLAALVLVLVATPDVMAVVFVAWILVLVGVAAVALGVAIGFRRHADMERARARPRYLTADWVGGAQVLTLDGASREAEEFGDAVVSTGEVAAVHGDGLASDEGRVA